MNLFLAKNVRMCDNQLADCRHIPKCDYNASCVNSARTGFACKCNENFVGNGQQCLDKDGNLSENPDNEVEIEMTVEHDFEVKLH